MAKKKSVRRGKPKKSKTSARRAAAISIEQKYEKFEELDDEEAMPNGRRAQAPRGELIEGPLERLRAAQRGIGYRETS